MSSADDYDGGLMIRKRDPITGRELVPCHNPACFRLVTSGTLYCCADCDIARQNRYDPDGYHSEGCDERAAQRGVQRGAPADAS